MEFFQILAIGFGSGLLLSVLSIVLFNSANAEKFPLGGFIPALWLLVDIGESSQLIEGGLLVIGGIFGYYLILAMYRGMPKRLSTIMRGHIKANNEVPHEVMLDTNREEEVLQGKTLADFL